MSNHNKETEARCFHCYRHYVEGTAAWALYMMRMGRKVTNPKYDPRVYHLPEGGMIQIDGMEIIAGNQWIDYWCIDVPDGWEIYEEPKPLLADAKGGDLCKLRNGEWRQIKGFGDSWGTNDCLNPNLFTVFLTDGTTRNIYGTYLGTTANPLPNDIIATEPLADEGSAEWALYQIRSGKKVVKEGGGERYVSSFYKNRLFYLNGFGCLVTKNAIGLIDPCSEEEFLSLDETGWQLYEPKPGPAPKFANIKVNNWVETSYYDLGAQRQTLHYERVVQVYSNGYFVVDNPLIYGRTEFDSEGYGPLFRKAQRIVDPSDVPVDVGVNGPVRRGKNESCYEVLIPKIGWVTYKFNETEPLTANLVRKLLKAQEEK
jgi:hypothetical protein